jgi:hypothetical protein
MVSGGFNLNFKGFGGFFRESGVFWGYFSYLFLFFVCLGDGFVYSQLFVLTRRDSAVIHLLLGSL